MKKWHFYTTNELKPAGWMKRQLQIQAEGLSGHLDKIWPDIRDSAWIGGDREGWERVPYWLDGFIPLAYLLEDEDMIARAKRYIDAIVAGQKPDGWICPCSDEERLSYDNWAVLLITKVLTVYYECSKDPRIPDVIYRTMKNFYDLLSSGTIKLYYWGVYRWFEGFIALNFLQERYGDPWIAELAKILREQGTDYNTLTHLWKRPLNLWRLDTHIVNLAMMLKYEAVSCGLLGEEYTDRAEYLHSILDTYNGTPVGSYTGDECLSGNSPVQGTELCAIVEQMYSCEHLFAATGDPKWAERLEVLAFNALPATISDDMWTHQYVQMSNQIACQRFPGKSFFRTNGRESHLFGLEPNFGCCTANFNQGWPKLALSAFMHSGDTVISAVPIPSELKTADKSIKLETNYPFGNSFTYTIQTETEFTFRIRIPSFAQNIRINGQEFSGSEASFSIPAGENRVIQVEFTTVPRFETRPHNLYTVKCGSLVFSLPISFEKDMREYEENGVVRKFPYCDYQLIPTSDWNYGFASPFLTVENREISEIPFSGQNPPVVIKASVQKIAWGLADGYETVCAKVPASTVPLSEPEEISLHPYGCSKLRMTELPFAR